MMTEAQIYEKLTVLFQDIFDDDHLTIHADTTAGDVAGWDSFNHINLIVSAEAAFGIKIQSAEIEELQNVGQFVKLIHHRLAAKG